MNTAKADNMKVSERGDLGAFSALPDDLLLYIGQTVLELCGIVPFIYFARTSKHIHTTLMDKDVISNILGSKNKWISDVFKSENQNYFKHVFLTDSIALPNERISSILQSENERVLNHLLRSRGYRKPCPEAVQSIYKLENDRKRIFNRNVNTNPSVTTPTNLEELELCQIVAEAKHSMGLTIYPGRRISDKDRYDRQLNFIADTLAKHPSALVVLDLHGGYFGDSTDFIILRQGLERFIQSKEWRSLDLPSRVCFRFRYRFCASELQSSFENHACFFEVGFRLGGVEVPPLRSATGERPHRLFSVYNLQG